MVAYLEGDATFVWINTTAHFIEAIHFLAGTNAEGRALVYLVNLHVEHRAASHTIRCLATVGATET